MHAAYLNLHQHSVPSMKLKTTDVAAASSVASCQGCQDDEALYVLQVQYAALHNFEDREEDFRADVVTLRRRFTSDGAPLQTALAAATQCTW